MFICTLIVQSSYRVANIKVKMKSDLVIIIELYPFAATEIHNMEIHTGIEPSNTTAPIR